MPETVMGQTSSTCPELVDYHIVLLPNLVHKTPCNGFSGYNGNGIGFNGNCSGPCGSPLVICCLLLAAC